MTLLKFNELLMITDHCPRMNGEKNVRVELTDCIICNRVKDINFEKKLVACGNKARIVEPVFVPDEGWDSTPSVGVRV